MATAFEKIKQKSLQQTQPVQQQTGTPTAFSRVAEKEGAVKIQQPKQRSVFGKVAGFLAPTITRTFEKLKEGEKLTLRDIAGSALEIGSFLIPTGAIVKGLGLAGKGAITAAKAAKAIKKLSLGKRVGLGAVTGALGGGLAEAGRAVGEEETGFGEIAKRTIGGAAFGAGAGATLPIAGAGVRKAFGGIKRKFGQKAIQRAEQEALLRKGATESTIARKTLTEAGEVVKDPIAVKAIRQGVPEPKVAAMKQFSLGDREKSSKMLNILKKRIKDEKFAFSNRTTDVVGETAMDQVRFMEGINKSAGQQIGAISKTLGGRQVTRGSVDGVINSFADTLHSFNVRPSNKKGLLNFTNVKSRLRDIPKSEKVQIQKVWRDLLRIAKTRDGELIHTVKQRISDVLEFDPTKRKEGVSAITQKLLKNVRKNLSQILNDNFDEYAEANRVFSKTKNALRGIGRMVGRRFDPNKDFAGKQLGQELRGLLSNRKNRAESQDIIRTFQKIAREFGYKTDESIENQIIFADMIEDLFGPEATTGIQGQMRRAITKAGEVAKAGVDVATGKPVRGFYKLGEELFDFATGRNQENLIKSIDDLLRVRPKTNFGKK